MVECKFQMKKKLRNGDEVDQPREAFERNVEETTQSGGPNETLARNEGSESLEVGLEADIPIGQLFPTPLAQNTLQ